VKSNLPIRAAIGNGEGRAEGRMRNGPPFPLWCREYLIRMRPVFSSRRAGEKQSPVRAAIAKYRDTITGRMQMS
jgi:hypothetical protein